MAVAMRGLPVVNARTHVEIAQATGDVALDRAAPASPAVSAVPVGILAVSPLCSSLSGGGGQRQEDHKQQNNSAMHLH